MGINILKLFLQIYIIFTSFASYAQVTPQVREFETTRLMSTGGTGVASILLNESAVLNPATVGLYDTSAIYFQGGKADLDVTTSTQRQSTGPTFGEGKAQAVIISDTSAKLRGSASYQNQTENNARRKRYTFTGASSVGKNSSFGITYRRTKDITNLATSNTEDSYSQAVLGVIHVLSEKFSIGTLLIDPFKTKQEQGRVLFGLQYTVAKQLQFMADVGANFNENFSDTAIYRGAIQTNFFGDFFFRFGVFHDENTQLRGNGWGVSWIGGKLNLDMAYKSSKAISNLSTFLYEKESLKEASFSASIFF